MKNAVSSMVSHLSHDWLFAILWTVAHQAPLSMGFSRKNTGVGCHALLQSIFLTQGSKPCPLYPLHWRVGSLPLGPPGKPHIIDIWLATSILTSHKKLLCWGILHLYSKLHSNVRCFTMREIINSCHKKYTLKDISKSLTIISEKATAPHSSTLAWKIPWTEEPDGLQSMGSLGVRHDWGNLAAAVAVALSYFPHDKGIYIIVTF